MARERIALRGIAASPGVGVGRAVVIGADRPHVRHHRIAPDDVEFEIERLCMAIERSRSELEESVTKISRFSSRPPATVTMAMSPLRPFF